MTIRELLEELQDIVEGLNEDQDPNIVLVAQPSYPFEHELTGCISNRKDLFEEHDLGYEGDLDDDLSLAPMSRYGQQAAADDVVIQVGSQLRYASKYMLGGRGR